jgi:hypothetical protein
MDIDEWAKREIEIAQKREGGNAPDGEWHSKRPPPVSCKTVNVNSVSQYSLQNRSWKRYKDYGCACYDSAYKAYKAFKSLLNDNHSGMSIMITKRNAD